MIDSTFFYFLLFLSDYIKTMDSFIHHIIDHILSMVKRNCSFTLFTVPYAKIIKPMHKEKARLFIYKE